MKIQPKLKKKKKKKKRESNHEVLTHGVEREKIQEEYEEVEVIYLKKVVWISG